VVPGDNDDQLVGKQGRTLEFENGTIRTDEDGLKEAVVNDATTVTDTSRGDEEAVEASATDGGKAAVGADSGDEEAAERGESDEEVLNKEIDRRITQEVTKRIAGNGAETSEVVDAVATSLEVDIDRVSERIDALLTAGSKIHQPIEGTAQTTLRALVLVCRRLPHPVWKHFHRGGRHRDSPFIRRR
jgi:hypothetical protein